MRAAEKAQGVTRLAAEPEDLCSKPRIHMMEAERKGGKN